MASDGKDVNVDEKSAKELTPHDKLEILMNVKIDRAIETYGNTGPVNEVTCETDDTNDTDDTKDTKDTPLNRRKSAILSNYKSIMSDENLIKTHVNMNWHHGFIDNPPKSNYKLGDEIKIVKKK